MNKKGELDFYLSRENMKLPDEGKLYGPGGLPQKWTPWFSSFIRQLESEGKKLRYGGAFVGDRDQVELYTTMNGQDTVIRPDIASSVGNSYERLIQNFVRHLDGDPTAEIITPREALIAVQIIEGLLRSAETGQEVRLA